MTDEVDAELVQEEPEGPLVEAIPGYLVLEDDAMKAEARRAFIMGYVTDAEGVLFKNWEEEAEKIEGWLKNGVQAKRTNMKVVK